MKKSKVLSIAERHARNGRYEQAIQQYSRLVEDDPSHKRIWLKLAELYMATDRPQLALEIFCRVAEQYAERGFEKKAIAIYNQALDHPCAPQEVNLRLGELHQRRGNRREAKRHFQAVVQHFDSGPVRLAALKQLASLDPETAEHRVSLAEAYLRSGLREKARVEYELAAQMLRTADEEEQLVEVVKRLIQLLPHEWPQGVPVSSTLAPREPPAVHVHAREAASPSAAIDLEIVFEGDEPHPEDLVVEDTGLHDVAAILPPTLVDCDVRPSPIPDPGPLDPLPLESLTLRSAGPLEGGEALEGRVTAPGYHVSAPLPAAADRTGDLAAATIRSGLHRVETCLRRNRLQDAKAILEDLVTLAPGDLESQEIEDQLAEIYFRELSTAGEEGQ